MKSLRIFLFLLGTAVLLFESYVVFVAYTNRKPELPAEFGNFDRVRALLEDDEPMAEFSFAVVGDIKGCGTFKHIAEELKGEPISFMVILGDAVRKGDPGHHQYWQSEIEDLSLPFPVFYLVGNHDITAEKFPLSRFENIYGPTNFYFEYQGYLFVGLRIIAGPHPTEESLEFLRNILSDRYGTYKKVFIFMHTPPPVAPDFIVKSFAGAPEFVSLIDRFKVDYVIGADYHGHARVKIADTVYLVTGGGGGRLHRRKYGMFHHAVVLRVGDDLVSERILQVDRSEEFRLRLKHSALAEVYPWLRGNRAAAAAINAGIVFSLLSLLWFPVRRKHRRTGR